MPSTHQSNTGGKNYNSEAGRFLSKDNDVNPIPVIRGIREYERALSYHQEAHKRDVDAEIKKAIARKLQELDE
jgi:hypothetical protein